MMRTHGRRGLTLIEVLIAIAMIAILIAALISMDWRAREKSNRSNCKGNLKNIGIACRLYLDGQGRRTQFPDRNGSDFLVLLYITGVASDSGSFLCPSSGDTNGEGADLVLTGGRGPNGTSYAGRDNARPSQDVYPGMFTTRNSSETSQASDDGEGSSPFNHGDAVTILFADGHGEELPLTEPRVGTFRSGKPTLLDPLSN